MKTKTQAKLTLGSIGLILLGYGAFWLGVLYLVYLAITKLL